MSTKHSQKTAPGANLSLIASIIAIFLVFVLANIASTLPKVPLVMAFLIAPSLAIIAGVSAVFYAFRSLRHFSRFRNSTDCTQERLAGKKRAITALVLGSLALMVSLLVIIAFSMWAFVKKATPNYTVGTVNLSYFGDANHREIAVQTILLPDSTRLTSGFSRPYNSPASGSGMLLKTDLTGAELWSKPVRGTLGKVAMLNDSTVINCRIVPYPRNSESDRDSLLIYRMDLDGNMLDTLIIRLGKGATVGALQPLASGGAVVAGVLDRGKDDYKGRSYLFRTDGQFAKQSLRTFPKILTGSPSGLAVDNDGSILIAGSTDEKVTGSAGTTEIRSWALTKISNEGDLIWNKPNLTEPDIVPRQLIITDADEMYMLGFASNDNTFRYGLLLKLDSQGDIIWSRRVTGEEAGYVEITSMLPRPGGWIVAGLISKRETVMSMTTQRRDSWLTYYISLLNQIGEIEHEFHGGRVRFEPWGIITLSPNSWLLTGMGNRAEKRDQDGEQSDTDIGFMQYNYSPADN